MNDTVQIKAELVEHQHDALMAFYEMYPRLFVNKLLLKLCEGCMPMFPPSLAQFTTTPPIPNAKTRKVVIRLSKVLYPVFWEFYKGLPYGARSVVIINLMNHYAQLAEGDRKIMEQVYWEGTITDSTLATRHPEPAITGVNGLGGEARVPVVAASEKVPVTTFSEQVKGGNVGGAHVLKAMQPQALAEDPLDSVEVGL